jgi:hypothetical protein
MNCIAAKIVPHLRSNAASAKVEIPKSVLSREPLIRPNPEFALAANVRNDEPN